MANKPQCVVVGAGFAGLQAALSLGRTLTETVVINAETPRNASTTHSNNFVTRDGIHPLEFLKIAKEQLQKYKDYVSYKIDTVTDIEKKNEEGRFHVKTASGVSYYPRWLVLSMGYQDHIEKWEIPGLPEVWGKSVWHCPFCDGFETQGKKIALFADEMGAHMMQSLYHFSKDLVVFSNTPGIIPDQAKELAAKNKVRIVEDKVAKIEHENGKMKAVHLVTGEVVPREFGFVSSTFDSCSDLPAKLGIEKSPMGSYKAEGPYGKTSVNGVYVVGDLKDYFTGGIMAAAQGGMAGEFIAMEIMEENFGKLDIPFPFEGMGGEGGPHGHEH